MKVHIRTLLKRKPRIERGMIIMSNYKLMKSFTSVES
jgi:hypothetical protein